MWITHVFLWTNCGQVPSYPQDRVIHNSIHNFIHRFYPSYPQVYPQVVIISKVPISLNSLIGADFIHSLEELSTISVDNQPWLWKDPGELSTGRRGPVDGLWTEYTFNAYFVLQSPIPGGGGLESSFALHLLGDLVYLGEDVAVAVYEVGDLCGGVHDGGVVASSEGLPYLGERLVGKFAGEVHGDLTGVGEAFGAALADEVGLRDAEVAADLVLDQLDGYLAVRLVGKYVPQDLLGEVRRDPPAVERGVGQDSHERAFEFTNVRRDFGCDKRQYVVVDFQPVHEGLLAQDGDPGLEVGGLDVCDQAPLEAADQAVLQSLDIPGVS